MQNKPFHSLGMIWVQLLPYYIANVNSGAIKKPEAYDASGFRQTDG
jgi:hypothetical protein